MTIQTLDGKIKAGGKLKETEFFKLLKAKINPNGADSCALFYRGKLLNYEYYTQRPANGKYINSKDTIAIDILIENGEYVIRVGTRRNNPDITRELAIAIDGEFRPGNTDVTVSHWHVHKKMPLSIDCDEMVRIKIRSLRVLLIHSYRSFGIYSRHIMVRSSNCSMSETNSFTASRTPRRISFGVSFAWAFSA